MMEMVVVVCMKFILITLLKLLDTYADLCMRLFV